MTFAVSGAAAMSVTIPDRNPLTVTFASVGRFITVSKSMCNGQLSRPAPGAGKDSTENCAHPVDTAATTLTATTVRLNRLILMAAPLP
ncbi:hypothetical protein GCM10010528_30190 [Gordonia defluvii]|uniref:Uncharacterized protein n=1 Tax=Gordonia defluvii TaxID=283718 RepID=A0ABP6LQY1_9ACTN